MPTRVWPCCALLLALAAAAPATEYDRQAVIVPEAIKLQGTWVLDSTEEEGKSRPALGKGERGEVLLSVWGTNFSLLDYRQREGDPPALPRTIEAGKFKIVPAKKGPVIDLLSSMNWAAGKERKGRYEFQGDVLRLCVSPPGGKDRPKSVATKGTRNTTYVFVRRRARR
jgi:uncharacterized protein (TIGR03067 family)